MPRDALFDLAVNRALSYVLRLGVLPRDGDTETLQKHLEPWYLKTRFAYRVPLEQLIATLQTCPGKGYYWSGGTKGKWLR